MKSHCSLCKAENNDATPSINESQKLSISKNHFFWGCKEPRMKRTVNLSVLSCLATGYKRIFLTKFCICLFIWGDVFWVLFAVVAFVWGRWCLWGFLFICFGFVSLI